MMSSLWNILKTILFLLIFLFFESQKCCFPQFSVFSILYSIVMIFHSFLYCEIFNILNYCHIFLSWHKQKKSHLQWYAQYKVGHNSIHFATFYQFWFLNVLICRKLFHSSVPVPKHIYHRILLCFFCYYCWMYLLKACSLRARAHSLYKPLKSDAPYFVYAFNKYIQQ